MKQKTKIKKDIAKVYYNKEMNEKEIHKVTKEIKTFKRAFCNIKNRNKN